MTNMNSSIDTKLARSMAELTCALAKTCDMKENYFAAMFSLTPAEFKCLRLFTHKASLSIKELGKKLELTPGRITHILTSLEAKKFVIRQQDERDKRNVIVHLTNKSIPFLRNINENHIKIHKEILNNIEPEKRELVIAAMQEVLTALKTWTTENKIEK